MVVFIRRYFIQFLILLAAGIWLSAFQMPDSALHIIACDVGQGDAILIFKGSTQILVDGGPNNKVLSCLSRYMPFWDREIELVVLTHPEKDHYFGLIEVFRRYRVDNLLSNRMASGSQEYGVLEKEVGSEGVTEITPDAGKTIRVGSISLDILHPAVGFQSTKVNEYSIVTFLRYKEFEALLTGDIDQAISDRLSTISQIAPVEYIKIPHHGSRNGLTENLLKAVDPKIAVISLGKNNSYGHPHQEVLDMLSNQGAKILRTDLMGDIEVVTDGEKIWVKD